MCAKCGQVLTEQETFDALDTVMGKVFASAKYCEKCGVYYCTRCTLEKWQKEQKKQKETEGFSVPQYTCPQCGKYLGSLRL